MFLFIAFLIPVFIVGVVYLMRYSSQKRDISVPKNTNTEQPEIGEEILVEIEDDEEDIDDALVVIYSAYQLVEAHFISARLESLGVESELLDETTVSINPLWSNAVGGVKVAVRYKDKKRALEILKELSDAPILNEEGIEVTCPKCNSDEFYTDFKTYKNRGGVVTGLMAVSIFGAAMGAKSMYRCKACGHEFEPESE